MKRPRRASKWLQPTDNIPEMDVEDCRKLFMDFWGIASSFVEGSKNLYRFVGDTLNEFVPDTPARTVSATNRGTHLTFDPLTILSLLDKFEKSEIEFKTAYNTLFSSSHPEPPLEIQEIKPN